MAVEHAIAALAEHIDDVLSRLDEEKREELLREIEALDGPERENAADALADFFVEELPPDHPVRRALSGGNLLRRSPEAGTAWLSSVVTAAILASVTARLARAAALTEDEVRHRGADPDDPGLIRLEWPGGGQRWLEFQFTPAGGPVAVVREVNEVLGASRDPVGAADWWLSRNAWLGDRPSELIGSVPDEHLLGAARAEGGEI